MLESIHREVGWRSRAEKDIFRVIKDLGEEARFDKRDGLPNEIQHCLLRKFMNNKNGEMKYIIVFYENL